MTGVSLAVDAATVAAVGWDGRVRVWSVPERRELEAEALEAGKLLALARAADGTLLIGTERGDVMAWAGGEVRRWTVADSPVVAVVAAREFFVAAADDSTVAAFDLEGPRARWRAKIHNGRPTSLALDPRHERLAIGDRDHKLRVYDATVGSELLLVGRHETVVSSVAFSPDGRQLASGGYDYVVRLWDAAAAPGEVGR